MFLDELFYALGQAYGLTCAAIYDTGNFALHNDGTDYFRQLVHGNKVVFVFPVVNGNVSLPSSAARSNLQKMELFFLSSPRI